LPDVIRIQSQLYNWNSSLTKFDNQPWPGVLEFSWSEKLDIKTVYSQTQNGRPVGGTSSKYEVDSMKVKMLRDSADAFLRYLAAKPPFVGSYGRTEFTTNLTVSEPLLPGVFPISMTAGVCRVRGKSQSHAEGTDELVTELDLWCRGIVESGITLYTDKTGLAGF